MADNINLPPATGSGADYTINNDSGGVVTVVADTTGTPDTIDGVASRNLQVDESITVVDYASDKWAII